MQFGTVTSLSFKKAARCFSCAFVACVNEVLSDWGYCSLQVRKKITKKPQKTNEKEICSLIFSFMKTDRCFIHLRGKFTLVWMNLKWDSLHPLEKTVFVGFFWLVVFCFVFQVSQAKWSFVSNFPLPRTFVKSGHCPVVMLQPENWLSSCFHRCPVAVPPPRGRWAPLCSSVLLAPLNESNVLPLGQFSSGRMRKQSAMEGCFSF